MVTGNGDWFVSDTPCISTTEREIPLRGALDGGLRKKWRESVGDNAELRGRKEEREWLREGEKRWKRCWQDDCWLDEPVCVCLAHRQVQTVPFTAALYPRHPHLPPPSLSSSLFISPPAAGELSAQETSPKVTELHLEGKFPNSVPPSPSLCSFRQSRRRKTERKRATTSFCLSH